MSIDSKLPTVVREGTGGTRYSDAVRRKVLAALKLGNTRNAAAGAAGVHRDTVYDWIKGDPEFAKQVAIAEDVAEARYVGRLTTAAARGDVGATKFWLERRRPNGWREKVTMIEALPDLEDVIDEAMTDDDLHRRLADLAAEALERGARPAAAGDAPSDEEASSPD